MSLFETIVSRTPIDRGWSEDRKFRAVTAEGETYFLRISPMDRSEQRKLQFSHMQQVHALGVPMSDPIEFGTCPEGCYTLLRWIEGRDAEEALPELTEEAQYRYGLEAGKMLRAIHSVPVPFEVEPWGKRFGKKLDKKLAVYEACPLKFDRGERLVEFIRENRHLIEDRPQVWRHGDYHCGNLMLGEDGVLRVIDFDREDIGDPWYEFNRIIWDGRAAPAFARGRIDGYFGGEVPEEFWRSMALYLSQNMLSSLPWALDFGETEKRIAIENGARVLDWYDDMTCIIPKWYR